MHPMTANLLKLNPKTKIKCECCGATLDPETLTWLEMHSGTLEWAKPGTAPWSDGPESQGCFPFGAACAKRVLKTGTLKLREKR